MRAFIIFVSLVFSATVFADPTKFITAAHLCTTEWIGFTKSGTNYRLTLRTICASKQTDIAFTIKIDGSVVTRVDDGTIAHVPSSAFGNALKTLVTRLDAIQAALAMSGHADPHR